MKRNSSYRKSQQIYKAFNEALASFEDIDPAIMGLTSSGEIVYVNFSACALMGYSKKELEGRPLETIASKMTAEDWSSFWAGLDHPDSEQGLTTLHLSGKKKFSVEFRTLFIHPSSLKYCLMTKPEEKPTTAVRERTTGWPLVQVLNSMTDDVVVIDDQHKVTFLNHAVCQSLGISLAEALATTVNDYLPKRQADIAWEHEQQALDSMRPSTRWGGGFLQAKYGDTVTMLPFLDPGTSRKRVLVIITRTPPTGRSMPAVIPESHERVPARPKPGYASELHEILEISAPLGIFLKNSENRYLWVNDALARMIGFKPKDIIGQRTEDLISDPEILAITRQEDDYIYSSGKPLFNQIVPLFNSQSGYYRLDKLPFINKNGKLTGIIGLVVEVDEAPPPIEALNKELRSMSQKVQETETALRVLIERREQDLALSSEALNVKVKDLVVPYLEHLKQTRLSREQVEYVNLIETNLKNFYDPAYAKLSSSTFNLSPTELKVAQLVRDGKTNKEIAQLLHLSKSTILTHRHHIRVKLGIKNQKVNLRSLLDS
jgi:PAS domain-containing protein/DNA-binding CsgD family transcriptional regulator